jgi:hypothetical protein
VDEARQKKTESFGRKSFIAEFNTPGRPVECIQNPRTGVVLWGEPYPRMPENRGAGTWASKEDQVRASASAC